MAILMIETQNKLETTNHFDLLSKRLLECLQNLNSHLLMKSYSINDNSKKIRKESSSGSSEDSDQEAEEDLENSFALTMSSNKESKQWSRKLKRRLIKIYD